MSVKVSVIIPVYNAEKYIAECIESLLAQTLAECEFIFINDGSVDQSAKIIRQYQKLDQRIKMVEQINQGVSIARNKGLDIASGEYIGFVDADDHIKNDMYEVLFETAKYEDCDIVISNFESSLEKRKVVSNYPFPKDIVLKKQYIQQNILPYFLSEDSLNTVCTKLIRNDLIRSSKSTFPKKVALGEDGMFSIQCLSHAERIKFIDYNGYFYREVEGSATRNSHKNDYFKRALEIYNLEIIEKYLNLDKETIQRLKSIKLIRSVMAYIYMFLNTDNSVGFHKSYIYIKNMINHENVREALPFYIKEVDQQTGKYERFLISMIKHKSYIGLYFANKYSRYRNK